MTRTIRTAAWVLLFSLFLAAGTASACELPAEPTAGAVPNKSDPGYAAQGVTIIDQNRQGTPFPCFVVPEASTLKIDVLWDPYDHGEGGGHSDAKYQGVANSGIAPLANYPMLSGYGFFSIDAMSDFFNVRGNRNDVQEAIGRSINTLPANQLLPCHDRPSVFINGTLVRSALSAAVDIQPSVRSPGYGDEAMLYPYTSFTAGEEEVAPGLDSILPNPTAPRSPVTTLAGSYKYKASLVGGSIGMYMGNVTTTLGNIDETEYKAYIVDSSPQVEVTGLHRDPDLNGPHYTVGFPTPTVGGGKIQTRVECPSVGFDISDIYWVWREQIETWRASGTEWIYEGASNRNCSIRIDTTTYKPGGGPGMLDYLVTDSRPPIAAKLEVTPPQLVCGQAMGDSDFTFTFVDTHPFGNIAATVGNFGGSPIYSQDPELVKSNFKLFFSYPEFEEGLTTTNMAMKDLASVDPVGPLVFATPNGRQSGEFKGTFSRPKWVWKQAQVVGLNIETEPFDLPSGGWKGGLTWKLTGKIRFNVLAPKAMATAGAADGLERQIYSAHGAQFPAAGIDSAGEVKKLMKLFAIVSDSAGHKSAHYDELALFPGAEDTATARSTAEFLTLANGTCVETSYNGVPKIDAAVTEATGLELSDGKVPWQKYTPYTVQDGTGGAAGPVLSRPEIQVVVFDTRNNRYHLLGDSNPAVKDYQFTSYDSSGWEARFQRFYNDPAGAADLMGEHPKPAFVAQNSARFLFYIRAWDNLSTYARPHQGIKTVACSIKDFAAPDSEREAAVAHCNGSTPYNAGELMNKPVVWQFREANCEANGTPVANKDCQVEITATDFAGNTSTMNIRFCIIPEGVAENTIRTLEERHKRAQ